MSLQARKFLNIPFVLILAILALIFGSLPTRVEAGDAIPREPGYYNSDGTLNLEGKTSDTFQTDHWDVQLDSELGPIFSSSSLAATTVGDWFALASDLAGTDSAISHPYISSWDDPTSPALRAG